MVVDTGGAGGTAIVDAPRADTVIRVPCRVSSGEAKGSVSLAPVELTKGRPTAVGLIHTGLTVALHGRARGPVDWARLTIRQRI